MKMYILVRDDIPTGFAVLAAAHASLACYLKFKETPEMQEWISGTFYKSVCKVTSTQFEKAKTYSDYVVLTESALNHQEVALTFKPRTEWSGFFKSLILYK